MNKYLENKKSIQVLVFKLNNVFYGIPVDLSVKEIAMFDANLFKKTIETEEHVIGSVILRDKMIPVIDLNGRYSIPKNELSQKSNIILKQYNSSSENLLSLLIEGVLDIKEVDVSKIVKKESVWKEIFGYIKINFFDKEDFMILLDANKFFEKKEKN